MLSNYIHKYNFKEDKEMCWSTKKYTKFRKEHEIKYRNFDEMQLETEEFNLKEQLMEANYNNNTIYYNIGLAYFAALLVLPQILDEKMVIDPIDLGAVKIIMVGTICIGLFLLLIIRGIFTHIEKCIDKRCRLKLAILKREKEHRKKNLG